jgi:hypothetical protein
MIRRYIQAQPFDRLSRQFGTFFTPPPGWYGEAVTRSTPGVSSGIISASLSGS